jgi:FkbM family methyltransferase
MKSFLFEIFRKIYKKFKGRGLRKINGVSKFFDILVASLSSSENIIEIQGSKMFVDTQHPSADMRKTFQIYAVEKIHEESTTDIFKKLLKEGDVVVDMGANIGYFTLLAAQLVGAGGKVYSFEPEPRNFGYLTKNIELNNYTQVNAFQKAVSDKNGTINLYVSNVETGSHTIIPDEEDKKEKDTVEIETISPDNFFKDKGNRIDFVKIDIEGAEPLAIKGMEGIIKENEDMKILMEFYPAKIKEMGYSPKDLMTKLFNEQGFRIFTIGGEYKIKKEKHKKINSVDELLSMCSGERDHINIFLEKGEEVFEKNFIQ